MINCSFWRSSRELLFLCMLTAVVQIAASPVTGRAPVSSPNRFSGEWNDYSRESFGSTLDQEVEIEPEVSPGLFEGDIAGISPEMVRLGINWEVVPKFKWPNGTVPYAISNNYLPTERAMIETAISIINFFTCVKFIPWDNEQPDYIYISSTKSPKGCWSYVGRQGGRQNLSLQKSDKRSHNCFGRIGSVIHELAHSIGILHEQSRPDRDKYVSVLLQNIKPGASGNFKKLNVSEVTTLSFPYDYHSVMHYGPFFFSQTYNSLNPRPTLIPKKRVRIGQRIMLSKLDCLKINALYGCFSRNSFDTNKYKTFCETLAY